MVKCAKLYIHICTHTYVYQRDDQNLATANIFILIRNYFQEFIYPKKIYLENVYELKLILVLNAYFPSPNPHNLELKIK